MCANADLGLVVSASLAGTCAVHLLSKGTYVRTIAHPVEGAPIMFLTLSNGGEITMYSNKDSKLHLFDVNGNYLAGCSAGEHALTSLKLCQGGLALLSGSAQGQVCSGMLSV